MSRTICSILGTAGVPGAYGGFETLAENLVRYHDGHKSNVELRVYCSRKLSEKVKADTFLHAKLRYIPLDANGPLSILYDALSLLDAVWRRSDVIVLLGVSGALTLPVIRAVSRSRIITNIDGVEWKRDKWGWFAKLILKWSERAAVRWSHTVIADNTAIAEHIRDAYASECHVIPYGGDHALAAVPEFDPALGLPSDYVFALCRIEPENNVAMILDSFAQLSDRNLVFVGNWNNSVFGRDLRASYSEYPNLYLVDPIYEPGRLRWIRDGAQAYVHGHSAGGTNPSLVEMMHFGISVLAFDCSFNRYTTEGKAIYFDSSEDLIQLFSKLRVESMDEVGAHMKEIALRRYSWESVGRAYFDLCEATT